MQARVSHDSSLHFWKWTFEDNLQLKDTKNWFYDNSTWRADPSYDYTAFSIIFWVLFYPVQLYIRFLYITRAVALVIIGSHNTKQQNAKQFRFLAGVRIIYNGCECNRDWKTCSPSLFRGNIIHLKKNFFNHLNPDMLNDSARVFETKVGVLIW